MIVAIEGVDYSGKSSALTGLAQHLNVSTYHTPPESFERVRKEVDMYASPAEHYSFYVLGIQEASRDLERMPTDRVVLVDRYWMTTVAYHRASGVDATLADFGRIMMPDVTIYLEVEQPELEARLRGRKMSECDKRDFRNLAQVRAEYDRLLEADPGVVLRIDTTHLTKAEVVTSALQVIPSLA